MSIVLICNTKNNSVKTDSSEMYNGVNSSVTMIKRLEHNKIWKRLMQIHTQSQRNEISTSRICIKGINESSKREIQVLASLCGFVWKETKEKNMWLMVLNNRNIRGMPSPNEPCFESFDQQISIPDNSDLININLDNLEKEVELCIKSYIELWLKEIAKLVNYLFN